MPHRVAVVVGALFIAGLQDNETAVAGVRGNDYAIIMAGASGTLSFAEDGDEVSFDSSFGILRGTYREIDLILFSLFVAETDPLTFRGMTLLEFLVFGTFGTRPDNATAFIGIRE